MTGYSSRNTLPCLPPVNTLLSRPQLGTQLQRPLLLPSVGLLPPQGEPTTLAELEVIDGDKSGPTQLIPAKDQGEGRELRLRETLGSRQRTHSIPHCLFCLLVIWAGLRVAGSSFHRKPLSGKALLSSYPLVSKALREVMLPSCFKRSPATWSGASSTEPISIPAAQESFRSSPGLGASCPAPCCGPVLLH